MLCGSETAAVTGRNRADELLDCAACDKKGTTLSQGNWLLCLSETHARLQKVETKPSCFLKCSLFLLLCCFVG